MTVTVIGDDEFDAEETAREQIGDIPLDDWAGADEDDELDLLDTDEVEGEQVGVDE